MILLTYFDLEVQSLHVTYVGILLNVFSYLCQECYVFVGVCLFVCYYLAGLRKNYSTDFRKIWWKGGTWAKEETFRCCW